MRVADGTFSMEHGHASCVGKNASRTYKSWQQMMARCHNPLHDGYATYGARGIEVVERWHSFSQFLEDMGVRPEGMSLDRKNNDLGYGPDNCKWSTPKQQAVNRKTTVVVLHDGQEFCLKDAAKKAGVEYTQASKKLKAGVPVGKVLGSNFSMKKG